MLLDKAIEYAQDVIDGKEITTKEVKIQCQWFLDDLAKQDCDDFTYIFDHDYIETVEGILGLLHFATGLGVVNKTLLQGLVGFQCFFLCNIFGWKHRNDLNKWRYSDFYLFICRKNSKTFLCAVILLILLLTSEKFSEMYSICLDRELAAEVKKAMSQIIDASPAISKYFVVPKTLSGKIQCKLTGSYYQPRTSDASRNNAIRPKVMVADEIGAFTDYDNINALKSGMLSVTNPLRFYLTTAYSEDKSIMLSELDFLKKIYNGTVKNDRVFALLYYADPEYLFDDFGMYQANPLRLEDNYIEIRNNRQNAIEKPLERVEFLTKHCNHFLPSYTGESYIDIEDLRKCKIDSFDWTGRNLYVGIDLAMTTDNCSVSVCTEEDLVIYADSFAFVPTDRIEEKNRMEKINYHDLIKEGKVFSCGDVVVDYSVIEDFIAQIEQKYGGIVVSIGYDRYNCLSTAQKLEKLGYKTVEVKQSSSVLHMATKLLKEKILQQEFHYTENKLLEINFQNARVMMNSNQNMYICKKKSTGKVDCVASLLNGIYLLQNDVIFNSESDWAIQVI